MTVRINLLPHREERRKRGRQHFAVLAGLQWKILIDAFDAAKAQLPDERWLDVRYEDFVAEPGTVMGKILEFLDLDWTPEFESAFRRQTFSAGRTDAYRSDLGIHEVAMLDACLAAPLERCGYSAKPENQPRRRRSTAKGDL